MFGNRPLEKADLLGLEQSLASSCPEKDRPGHNAQGDDGQYHECRWCTLEFRARQRMLRFGFPEEPIGLVPEEVRPNVLVNPPATLDYWLDHLDDVRDRGLILYVHGAGKEVGRTALVTTLAKAYLLHHVHRSRYTIAFNPQYTPEQVFFGEARVAYFEAALWEAFCQQWESACLWVLDDLGREVRSGVDWERRADILQSFLRHRADRTKPTILASSLSPTALAEVYASRSLGDFLTGRFCRSVEIVRIKWPARPTAHGWGPA